MIEFDWTIVLQVINFLVLMFVLTAVIYKPLLKMLDERRAKIENDIEEAEKLRAEAKEENDNYKKVMANVQRDAQELKNQIRETANKEAKLIVAQAKYESQRILDKANKEISHQVSQAKKELTKDITDLSVNLSSMLLTRDIKEDDHKELIKVFVSKLGD